MLVLAVAPAPAGIRQYCDYLGSIRAIVNADGEVEQTVDYLSTGIPIKGGPGEIIDDRLYTGKQYLSLNGSLLYDNVARYYSPVHGRFITPDALSGDYPHISHYSHCANNPLSIIDPTGMDIWRLNNQGYVVDVEETTEYDKLEMIDNEEKSIKFEHGTIISQKSYEYKDGKTYDVWKVRGDENATQMFEFMSDNITGSDSKVEIGLAQTGIAGDNGLNFITTGHARGSEPGLTYLFKDQLQNGYTIRTITHSHPESNYASKGDKKFVEWIKSIYNRPLLFNIYYVPSGEYINIPQL